MLTPLHGHGGSFLILLSQVSRILQGRARRMFSTWSTTFKCISNHEEIVSDTNELVPSDVYRSFGHLGRQTIIFLMHKELCAQKALGQQRLTHGYLAFVEGSHKARDAHNLLNAHTSVWAWWIFSDPSFTSILNLQGTARIMFSTCSTTFKCF